MTSTSNARGYRASFSSRISNLLERRRAPPHVTDSDSDPNRDTATFEVPLFLSSTRYQQPRVHDEDVYEADAYSRSSVQSLVNAATPFANRPTEPTVPASSRYSSPASSPYMPQLPSFPPYQPPPVLSNTTSRSNVIATSYGKRSGQLHQRRRRRRSTKRRIQGLRRISAVFGLTLLVTLVTYLVLAVTGAASGIMFHVLMVLFILTLTGVVTHSIVRAFMLSRKAKTKRSDNRQVQYWPDHQQQQQPDGMFFGQIPTHGITHSDEVSPEKPIQVIMAADEEAALEQRPGIQAMKYPPPVYGNFRTSKRMNPALMHWQKVPPSPLTPTYDQAISDGHRAVGYRPPSYIESDSGATRIVERGRQDVDRALRDIHPLERERVAQLGRNVI